MTANGGLSILLIEDNGGDVGLFEAALARAPGRPIALTVASSLADGLARLDADEFDVVVTDLDLPDSRGLEPAREILRLVRDRPVLVLTGQTDQSEGIEAVNAGAQDYLVKEEMNGQSLLRAIDHAIERTRLRAEMARLVMKDPLTGLPNRLLLTDRLAGALARGKRRGVAPILVFVDLDGFKAINDAHGHLVGDALLARVAERLLAVVRRQDTVARYGGDEFVVVLEDIKCLQDAEKICRQLKDCISLPFRIDSLEIHVEASVGMAVGGEGDPPDVEALLSRADEAMYREKNSKRRRGGAPDASAQRLAGNTLRFAGSH